MLKKIYFEYLNLEYPYKIGILIALTIIFGLFINNLLPTFNINDPLKITYIFPLYAMVIPFIFITIIKIFNWIITSKLSIFQKVIIAMNPFIAILGAIYINNSNNSLFALISVVLLILNFLITIYTNIINKSDYYFIVYSMAISLLLANSLRSSYLYGFDIHQEFRVFINTNSINFWDINSLKDAYNACLSITILPTIISNLTNIDNILLFKFFYPFLIALIPTVVFLISNRLVGKKEAFIATFAFIIQAQFITQLPALLRQGIAMLFFALIIDILVRHEKYTNFQKLLFILFIFSMIVSHYSTTYICILILTITKLLSLIINRFHFNDRSSKKLTIPILIVTLCLAFFWNTLITNTSVGVFITIKEIFKNINNTFSLDNKSEVVRDIFYNSTVNSENVKLFKQHYSINTDVNYNIIPITIASGKPISSKNLLFIYFRIIVPWIFRILIIVGFLVYFIKYKKYFTGISLAFAMFLLTGLMITLPVISVNYNFERFFQQVFVFLSVFFVVGLLFFVKYCTKYFKYLFIALFLISYFLQATSLIDYIIYNKGFWMFSNSGEQYLRYYTMKGEVEGIKWLDKNFKNKSLIITDRYTKNKIQAYSDILINSIKTEIIPEYIKNNYVIQSYASLIYNIVYSEYNNSVISYNFPTKKVNYEKNNIYSNSQIRIYK